jgi:hypothetical protein
VTAAAKCPAGFEKQKKTITAAKFTKVKDVDAADCAATCSAQKKCAGFKHKDHKNPSKAKCWVAKSGGKKATGSKKLKCSKKTTCCTVAAASPPSPSPSRSPSPSSDVSSCGVGYLERKDTYGNCIPETCESWYDGCNNCGVMTNGLLRCTLMWCQDPREAKCNKYSSPPSPSPSPSSGVSSCESDIKDSYGNCVPATCETWFDGCNNCGVMDGGLLRCTKKFCMLRQEEKCTKYTSSSPPSPSPSRSPSSGVSSCGDGYFERKDTYGNCVPEMCETWSDGCNSCGVMDGGLLRCTRRWCEPASVGEGKCNKWSGRGR